MGSCYPRQRRNRNQALPPSPATIACHPLEAKPTWLAIRFAASRTPPFSRTWPSGVEQPSSRSLPPLELEAFMIGKRGVIGSRRVESQARPIGRLRLSSVIKVAHKSQLDRLTKNLDIRIRQDLNKVRFLGVEHKKGAQSHVGPVSVGSWGALAQTPPRATSGFEFKRTSVSIEEAFTSMVGNPKLSDSSEIESLRERIKAQGRRRGERERGREGERETQTD
ncbi:hypothetical protein IE53DRAFT_88410 [Violaceomyces palustris]|uniref:Uncharacterized protein n=1 Tax=Violaceomyces palustris TaxID=1673888 RepID=A0ACD0NXQ5_9BASI|nr:hypothetical protein IE53DRAFT_88410 [Violaceomyces palustris]